MSGATASVCFTVIAFALAYRHQHAVSEIPQKLGNLAISTFRISVVNSGLIFTARRIKQRFRVAR